jgi:hypothetical protein
LGRGGQFWRKGGGIMVSNWLLQQTTLQHQHPPNLVFVGRGHYYFVLLFILIINYYYFIAEAEQQALPPSRHPHDFYVFCGALFSFFCQKFGHYYFFT